MKKNVFALAVLLATAPLTAQDCESDCGEDFAEGTVVELLAVPDEGSKLVGWSGNNIDCNDGSVTMTQDTNCIAVFAVEASIPVQFTASCMDSEEGDITANWTFTSDIQGLLGTGGSFSVLLDEGVHQISGQCCDSQGACYNELHTVTVVENVPPVGVWTDPADGACFGSGCPAN